MTHTQMGILGCILLVILLMSSLPVAFVMAIVGAFGFAILVSPHAALSMTVSDLYSTFSSYSLIVIPLFVFMGQIAFHSGISRRLFDTAYHWLGPLPGGLAMATVGACTGFGAICGSSPATAATMAAVAIPEMKRYKYDMGLASGVVASAGSLGIMIPPSVVFIVYAILTEQSIGKLFLAGILPGLLIAFLFCLTIYFNCKINPHLGPAGPRSSWKMKFKSLAGVSETIIIFITVIGGMFLGFFTPTEAAAIGAAATLIIAVIRRQMTFKSFIKSLHETVRTSCMVMIIVAGAVMFGHFLAITRLPFDLAEWLAGLSMPGWFIIALIIFFYLIAGCFVDALALVLLTTPIFFPVIMSLKYDPIWFGVMIVVVTQMGVISPPVGINVYVVNGIERDISLQTIFKGALPFLGALIVASAILTAFPEISLFIPNLTR